MGRAEMNAHKPNPTSPSSAQIAQSLLRDLDHWDVNGFGRYVVREEDVPIGLCGLTLRDRIPGLNLSYHIAPERWGEGHSTALVAALVHVAQSHLLAHAEVYGLVRPANPASRRVLEKSGFSEIETLTLDGAATTRFTRRLV